jgi:hypothetical protein
MPAAPFAGSFTTMNFHGWRLFPEAASPGGLKDTGEIVSIFPVTVTFPDNVCKYYSLYIGFDMNLNYSVRIRNRFAVKIAGVLSGYSRFRNFP